MELYVQNVSIDDVRKLKGSNNLHNTLLISISDNDVPYPVDLGKGFWSAVYYQFLDVDEARYKNAISDGQAKGLITWIEFAKRHNKDILVHCTMGINRSGAVREVAEIMGYTVIGQKKGYNAYVKNKLMQAAGMTYAEEPNT